MIGCKLDHKAVSQMYHGAGIELAEAAIKQLGGSCPVCSCRADAVSRQHTARTLLSSYVGVLLLSLMLRTPQVSLTSSVDRECGAALYLVLFAVLLDMRE
jgi:hypothetical protein